MKASNQYVWYASYGSNINTHRFLCYIQGGKPAGSTKVELGCNDQSLPVDESTFTINHPLYFAKESARWGSQAVAFIGLTHNKDTATYSKKYLITIEQFLDIVKQENDGIEFDINLNEVIELGSKIFNSHSWYGNILYLGENEGYPIFTFTAPWEIGEVELKKPSHAYLSTIINGLKNDYSSEDIYQYFLNKPGIKDLYTDEELASVVY